MRKTVAVRMAVALALVGTIGSVAPAAASAFGGEPNFGPNVIVFNSSMSQSQIQSTLNSIATQQVPNQFGSQRYTIFFEPGTYGSTADPLTFQVGYYTQVAGLGAQPGDVVINGSVDVYNQCSAGSCVALDNFWRSLSNLTINVLPGAGCTVTDFWAVSQAAPMRRVHINGQLSFMDYCTGPSFASGGFVADSVFSGSNVVNGSQQQFFTRNSNIDSWSNGVWNQVFLGDNGAPATDFGAQPPAPAPPTHNEYTNVPNTPVSQEEPFLYTDSRGAYNAFVPAVQHDSVGSSYASGTEAGTSIPIWRFFIANPDTPVWEINAALAFGQNLILTPGVYNLNEPIEVTRPGTIVMGLGFATLIPQNGNVTMETANVPGIKLSGMIFDAGPTNSPALLVVGAHGGGFGHGGFGPGRSAHEDWPPPARGGASEPTLVQDVFFRVGGAEPGKATTSLIVNTDHTILDDVWAWRADHGNGVGWTSNTADTGVIVNGDDVDAYGLFVEHYQKFDVIWNGRDGEDVFFQNEMPYDPPSQAAWMSSPTTDGYAAFLVTRRATGFQGYGMGSYSFFNQGVPIFATQAFQSEAADTQDEDLLTIFLNSSASGGILSVINGMGGSSTAANPDTPVVACVAPNPCSSP